MRKYIVPIVAVVALGIATPASAYDSGDLISMQEALSIATELDRLHELSPARGHQAARGEAFALLHPFRGKAK